MIVNNSESISNMFFTYYELIYIFYLIKLLFCNLFIRSFNYLLIIFELNKYF